MSLAPLIEVAPVSGRRRANPVALTALFVGALWLLSLSSVGAIIAVLGVLALAVTWDVERMVVLTVALTIGTDDPSSVPYNDLWTSPIQDIGNFWFQTIGHSVAFLPIPMAPMVVVPLILLVRVAQRRTGPKLRYEPLRNTIPTAFGTLTMLSLAVLPVIALWGVGTGGSTQQVYYQIFGILIVVPLTAAVARVSNPDLNRMIWDMVFMIALYRACLAIWIWWSVSRQLDEQPLYLTSHGDSLLFVIAMVAVISRLVESNDRAAKILTFTALPWLGLAMIVNNRRLAWVVLFAAIAYVILSASTAAKTRLMPYRIPAIVFGSLYTAAGWLSPPSQIFAPVQAMKSIITASDRSTQTRDIEDFNLVTTMRFGFPFPRGFGQPYIESVVADDISAAFPQYQYLPHNSLLGMLMLAGPIGLAFILAPMIYAQRGAHGLRKGTQNPTLRTRTALMMTVWIGFVAHAWGDLGYFSALPVTMAAIGGGLGLGMRYANDPFTVEWSP